jgi:lipid A oxidase
MLNTYFSEMQFTHGVNMFSLTAFYRWPMGRFTPYAGFGLGPDVPFVIVSQVGFPQTYKYELAGFNSRLYGGVELAVWRGIALFAEYQLSYNWLNADLTGGGTIKTQVWDHHVHLGLSYKFKVF